MKHLVPGLLASIALVFPLALPQAFAAPAADTAGRSAQPRTPRGELVHRIVMKWGAYVQEAYGADVRQWARDMGPLFARASVRTLDRAANARDFDAMNAAFQADAAGSAALGKAPIKANLLGEASTDLVYVPITPCRILDTRLAGGQIPAGGVRGVDVTSVSNYSFQGGASSNCGGAGAAGSFAAAAINFTIVSPQGTTPGHMTAYPSNASLPTSASLNFNPGDVKGNLGIFKLDQGSATNELNVYSTHATHLVGDLVGYFIQPQLGALDCVDQNTATFTAPVGGMNGLNAPACPSGYTVISGGCSVSTPGGRVLTSRVLSASNSYQCIFGNDGPGTMQVTAHARCCRLPSGR